MAARSLARLPCAGAHGGGSAAAGAAIVTVMVAAAMARMVLRMGGLSVSALCLGNALLSFSDPQPQMNKRRPPPMRDETYLACGERQLLAASLASSLSM